MINKVGVKSNISFGRALSSTEMQDYKKTLADARNAIGEHDKSILIVSDSCLPQSASNNTGVGHLASKESDKFFEMMKSYLGINTVEVLPQGRLKEARGCYCSYGATALSLGEQQINLELLSEPKFGSLISKEDFEKVVKSNTMKNKETMVNFENVVEQNSSQDVVLRKAYENFKNSDSEEVKQLKVGFEQYKQANDDWLEPKGIFDVLANEHKTDYPDAWKNEVDKNLYNPDFDKPAREARLAELKANNADNIEFYKFKQFIADEHLKLGKENLNKKNMKLFGDCLIGFSKDEVWANPKAFQKGATIGLSEWGLPALDFNSILDENSPAAKLLNKKVELFAKRYDGIRFDVSWVYASPIVTPEGAKSFVRPIGETSKILSMIEKTVKKVKGEDFDLKNLIHEVEAGSNEFKLFNNDGSVIEPYKNRVKVFGSHYMGEGWGSNDAFLNRGFSADGFVIGVGNHDPMPLRQLAKGIDTEGIENLDELPNRRASQIDELSRILKLEKAKLQDSVEFAKAKFAEPVAAKNNMVFYMDVFGREERFDSQKNNGFANYRYKIADSFESDYHKAVQEGFGFNIMDSFQKIFKARGLKEKYPVLYQKIKNYSEILSQKGALTEAEANDLYSKSLMESASKHVDAVKKSKPMKSGLIAGGVIAFLGLGLYALLRNKNEAVISDKDETVRYS